MGLKIRKAKPRSVVLGLIIGSALFFGMKPGMTKLSLFPTFVKNIPTVQSLPIGIPQYAYENINLDLFEIREGEIENGVVLSQIFSSLQIDQNVLHQLLEKGKDVFDVRKLRAGKNYKLLTDKKDGKPTYFIYESDPVNYYVFDLHSNLDITKGQKPVDTIRHEMAGVIESSLWNAFHNYNVKAAQIPALTAKMEGALAWSVDFHHVQPGDNFKLIYEEYYVDDTLCVGVGDLKAAYFDASGKEFYAYRFNSGKYDGFFNEEGRPMKKAFLKAPVEYSRISSRYNPGRFHPILKKVRAHLGTDYAAPHGTPIVATADGTIERIGYTSGNGNFIKIKHDKTYATQYLHMSKFKSGMAMGSRVKQGEVIGFVGATGLATGPHVCYRFWKNGNQVDPMRENLPEPEPMDESMMPAFNLVKEELKAQLEAIQSPVMLSQEKSDTEADLSS